MPDLRIRPLNLGVLNNFETSTFLPHRHIGEKLEVP